MIGVGILLAFAVSTPPHDEARDPFDLDPDICDRSVENVDSQHLRFVGRIETERGTAAVLRCVDGTRFVVRVGDVIGFGVVERVEEAAVKIRTDYLCAGFALAEPRGFRVDTITADGVDIGRLHQPRLRVLKLDDAAPHSDGIP